MAHSATPTDLNKRYGHISSSFGKTFPRYAPERDLIVTSEMQVKRTGQNHRGCESLRRNAAQIFFLQKTSRKLSKEKSACFHPVLLCDY